jgi:hypothetical protein
LVWTTLTIKISNRALSIPAILAVRTTPFAVRNLPGVAPEADLRLALPTAASGATESNRVCGRDVDDTDVLVLVLENDACQQGEVGGGVIADNRNLFLPRVLF